MADNIGLVQVSNSYLARVLGYKDGKIRDIRTKLADGYEMIDIVLEHPSFLPPNEGDYLPIQEIVRLR